MASHGTVPAADKAAAGQREVNPTTGTLLLETPSARARDRPDPRVKGVTDDMLAIRAPPEG
jgi:hypothetical protein